MSIQESLNVVGLQMNLQWQDPKANHERMESMMKHYPREADVIVLPEMFPTGFVMEAEDIAQSVHGESVEWMRQFSQKHDALVIGSIAIEEDGKYYNRLFAFDAGDLVLQYDKRHLFRMAGEHEHYTAGNERLVLTYKGWRICPMVCYDLRFPVWSRNRGDYDLLLYVANWPAARVRHWDALLKARAIENQAFVLGVNRVGTDGNEIEYVGNSVIFDPLGKELAYCSKLEVMVAADLMYEDLTSYREKFPAWQDADEFELK